MDEDQPLKPSNILNIVATNQGHIELTGSVATVPPLTVDAVRELMDRGHVLIDTRSSAAFGAGHIKGSFHVKQSSSEFEQRVGWVVPDDTPMVLLAETPEIAQACIYKMAFIALDRFVVGYLDQGVDAWTEAGLDLERTPQIDVKDLMHRLSTNGLRTLDVRETDEWEEGHIEGAHFMPYRSMAPQLDVPAQIDTLELAVDDPIAVVCGAGNRSSTAISLLLRAGYQNLYNVTGGMTAWKAAGLPMVDATGKACNL